MITAPAPDITHWSVCDRGMLAETPRFTSG
jgi:hypothetical protein